MEGAVEERWSKLTPILTKRLQRWSTEPGELLKGWRHFAESRPPAELACSVLRTACYAWCTTARFARPVDACAFCGTADADRQTHYVRCPVFREWMRNRLGFQVQGGPEEMTSWFLGNLGGPANHATRVAIAPAAFLLRRSTRFDPDQTRPQANYWTPGSKS